MKSKRFDLHYPYDTNIWRNGKEYWAHIETYWSGWRLHHKVTLLSEVEYPPGLEPCPPRNEIWYRIQMTLSTIGLHIRWALHPIDYFIWEDNGNQHLSVCLSNIRGIKETHDYIIIEHEDRYFG